MVKISDIRFSSFLVSFWLIGGFFFSLIITCSLLVWLIHLYHLPFDDSGNYFDSKSEISYHDQAILPTAIFMVLFLALTLFLAFVGKKRFLKT